MHANSDGASVYLSTAVRVRGDRLVRARVRRFGSRSTRAELRGSPPPPHRRAATVLLFHGDSVVRAATGCRPDLLCCLWRAAIGAWRRSPLAVSWPGNNCWLRRSPPARAVLVISERIPAQRVRVSRGGENAPSAAEGRLGRRLQVITPGDGRLIPCMRREPRRRLAARRPQGRPPAGTRPARRDESHGPFGVRVCVYVCVCVGGGRVCVCVIDCLFVVREGEREKC